MRSTFLNVKHRHVVAILMLGIIHVEHQQIRTV